MTLKQQYASIVGKYIKNFCKKQEIEFDHWPGDEIGTIACCGDYFFNFDDIRYGLDENIPVGKIKEWHSDYADMCFENKEIPFPNYKNWLKINEK